MSNSSVGYLPMLGTNLYIGSGLAISIFGPLGYLGYDIASTAGFVTVFLVLFSLGYVLGVNRPTQISSRLSRDYANQFSRKLFVLSCWVSFFVTTFLIVNAAATGGINFNIFKTGEAYIDSYDGYERNQGSYSKSFLITSLGALCVFVTTIWGLYSYKLLTFKFKLLVIYTVVGSLLIYTLGGGKQKQFGDMIVYCVCLYAIKRASTGRLSFGFIFKTGATLLVGASVLMVLLASRYRAIGIDIYNHGDAFHPLMYLKEDSFVLQILGDNLGFVVAIFCGYLGQGYFGLSLALNQDFTWTAFAGSSYSISVILTQFFGLPFMVEESYPYLVGKNTGWGSSKWHSVFAWLASDLTFSGTLAFGFVFGYGYAVCWRESIFRQNPYSVLMFCLLTIGIAYAPANNQLMHSPGALLALFGTVILYFCFRKSFNFRDSRPDAMA